MTAPGCCQFCGLPKPCECARAKNQQAGRDAAESERKQELKDKERQ